MFSKIWEVLAPWTILKFVLHEHHKWFKILKKRAVVNSRKGNWEMALLKYSTIHRSSILPNLIQLKPFEVTTKYRILLLCNKQNLKALFHSFLNVGEFYDLSPLNSRKRPEGQQYWAARFIPCLFSPSWNLMSCANWLLNVSGIGKTACAVALSHVLPLSSLCFAPLLPLTILGRNMKGKKKKKTVNARVLRLALWSSWWLY